MQEVGRLQQHVAELGEREPRLEPHLDGVLGEHVRHREVLADVAQEVEQAERRRASRGCSTRSAWVGPGAKSRKRASWSRIAWTLALRSPGGRAGGRSAERPDGSPIRPVPPPTTATGWPPKRWSRTSPKIGIRWPTWSERTVGSKPLYARRSARRSPGAPPGRPWWPGRGRASAARAAGRRGGRALTASASAARGRVDSGPGAGIGSACHLCYRDGRHADQPRPAAAPPPERRRRSARPVIANVARVAIALPLFLFASLLIAGVVGLRRGGGRVQLLQPGPARPEGRSSTTSTSPRRRAVYDRTGKVELASFAREQRDVVTFDQIPPVLIDATTSIEDKTFWENAGFDPAGILSAALDTLTGNPRGASTITQQLVRARLLPAVRVRGHRRYERKIHEIIQSIRLTQEFPGVAGQAARSSPPTSTRTSTATAATASRPPPRATGASPTSTSSPWPRPRSWPAIPQSPTDFDLVRTPSSRPAPTARSSWWCPRTRRSSSAATTSWS